MRYILVALLLLAVSCSAIAADWNAFVIRNADGSGIPPAITDNGSGGKIFAITLSGQKAAWATNYMNGKRLGDISSISISRATGQLGYGPYLNIWVKDANGKYAVIANEPSNLGEYTNPGGAYSLTWDVLKNATAKAFEYPVDFVLPVKSGGDHYHFSDFADYVVATPTSHQGGTGAPDDLNAPAYTAYGVNWVFGDTQGNYVTGQGYSVSNPKVLALQRIPSFGTNGWYSSDTRTALGVVLNGLNYTHLGTGTAADDALIAQQIEFVPEGYSPSPVGTPLTVTGTTEGALQLYGTTDNRGKAHLSRLSLSGFGSAADLLGSAFYATYRQFTIANPTYRTPGLSIAVVGTDGKWYSLSHVDVSDTGIWTTPTVTAASGFSVYGNGAPGGAVTKSLIDWASDPVYGPIVFGSGAVVKEFGFNLGSYQRNAYAYIDWVETNIIDEGARNDFVGASDQLALNPSQASIFVKTGESVLVNLDVSNLAQPVNACQALVGYDSAYLTAGAVAAGGGAWDNVIYQTWSVAGEINTAIGVDAQGSVGAQADATVAKITLTAGNTEGKTKLVFLPNVSDVKDTHLTNMSGLTVWPAKFDSTDIIIDGTAPLVAITAPADGLKTNVAAVTVTGTASDPGATPSGLKSVTVNGVPAIVAGGNWSAAITLTEGVNTITATAEDNAGNTSSASISVRLDTVSPTISINDNFGADPVLRGNYVVTVTASDGGSGLSGVPAMTWDGLTVTGMVAGAPGTWYYGVAIDQWTTNGAHTITANISDLAGNPAIAASRTITVNKNQITGTVRLEGYIGGTRPVDFSVNSGAIATQSLTFDSTGTAFYTLKNLPDSAFTLSAKSNWNLRQRLEGVATPPVAGTFAVLPSDANDGSVAPVGVAGDAATDWGTGSWKANGTAVTTMLMTPAQLFGRDNVKLGELKSISYWTKKGTTHVADASDWFLVMYTQPYPNQPVAGKWYGGRFGSEPYFSAQINEIAGAWNKWQTDEGVDNRLRFFDSTLGTFGGYNDGFLSDLTSNAAYKDQVLMRICVATGSGWVSGFTGQVDGLTIELTTGEIAKVNFEAVNGPTFILRGGDLNGTNSININDYSLLKINWTVYPATVDPNNLADVNGDTLVNTTDYNIMKGNWFKVGDGL